MVSFVFGMQYKLLLSLLLLLAIAWIIPPTSTEKIIKIAKYEASLYYTKMTQPNWWTKIEPYDLYLGGLPLQNEGHKHQILSLGVHSILSFVEDFELEEGFLNTPVKHEEWNQAGLYVEHIKAIDFSPLKKEEIKSGVSFLAHSLFRGHSVYVHCKAGRGRSATIVVAFLIESEHLSIDAAIARLKEQRPEINLNAYQRQALIDYYTQLHVDELI